MSIEAVTWALGVPVGGNEKVMLIGLANHAHPDGTEAYPSLDTLARYGHCDRSTARRNVNKLVRDGWAIEDGVGPRGQNRYRLPLHRGLQNATPTSNGGVASAPQGGGTSVAQGVAPVQPEPSLEPSKEPSTHPSDEGAPDQRPLSEQLNMRVPTTVDRKRVKPEEGDNAVVVLQHFNNKAGTEYRAKDFLEKIIRRMREHPEVGLRGHMEVVEKVLGGKRWWSGKPDPRIVYGNAGQFEKCLNDDGSAPQNGRDSQRAHTMASLDRIRQAG